MFVKTVIGDPQKSDDDCVELILEKSAGPIKSSRHEPSAITGFNACSKDFRISSSQNFSVYFALPAISAPSNPIQDTFLADPQPNSTSQTLALPWALG